MPSPYFVIMAGGRGERFWPESRLRRPKQLLPIVGEGPMLRQTLDRLSALAPRDHILILTNRLQEAAVREMCPDLPPENIVGEPAARDTAAAVALALLLVSRRDPGAVFAMLPSDAAIHNTAGFHASVRAAVAAAEREEAFVTLGIPPTHPATGYGYIETAGEMFQAEGLPVFKAARFVEKPNEEKAKEYVASGRFLWNAGLFFWRASVLQKAFKDLAPDIWASLQTVGDELESGLGLDAALDLHYPQIRKISVDFALLEKFPRILVVPATFDWDDVGDWPAVARHLKADADGNTSRGPSVVLQGKGNIVVNDGKHVIALLGVDDLVVVQTPDATLVVPKARAQEIKALLKAIEADPTLKHLL